LCEHSTFSGFLYGVRRACAGELRSPALSGIRPISLKSKEEHCASTVSSLAFTLARLIAYAHYTIGY